MVAALAAYGEPLRLREVPLPEPETGALLVRIAAATVCGSDVHLVDGHMAGSSVRYELPLVPGHEMVGEIVAMGPDADADSVGRPLRPGDRVVWSPAPCGRCHPCTILRRPNLCQNRVGVMQVSCERFPYVTGAFGEYGYVFPRSGRIRVPDEVPDALAAAASCAGRSAVNVLAAAGAIDPSQHVAVQGSGPLGLFATVLTARQRPASLTVIGAPADRLAIARDWGADATIDVGELDAEGRLERLRELTGGHGADVVLECSGAPPAFAEALDLAAIGARVVVAGTLGGPPHPVAAARIPLKGLRVAGVFSADADAYDKALELVRRTRDEIDWGRLLAPPRPLSEVNDALAAMRAGTEIKPLIVPGSDRP